ncbi:Uncharacterised protein [Yersinia enterocolitica]|nr:Uncharacterised protein [Yersinia enterocolitica]
MVAETKAATRQTNLAEHRGNRHQQPMLLLTVVLALNPPTAHDHGALLRHIACQLAYHISIDTTDICRPFCCLRLAVGFP